VKAIFGISAHHVDVSAALLRNGKAQGLGGWETGDRESNEL
jgi:hypothetical protein